MAMNSPRRAWPIKTALAGAILFGITPAGSSAAKDGREGDGATDRADKALEKAARDSSRAEERTLRDQSRYIDERAKIMDRAAREPAKTLENLAKLDADRSKNQAKAAEDAAKDSADLAKDLAKAQEDAAKAALESHQNAAEDDQQLGDSRDMRDLGKSERPEFDERGFPVRRGEIVALDLKPESRHNLEQAGFTILGDEHLPAIGGDVTRLAVPEGVSVGNALRRIRQIDPDGTFDYGHYYGLQITPSGGGAKRNTGSLTRHAGKLTIGMIDTAVTSHSALRGAKLTVHDFGGAPATAPVEHGTAIASLLVNDGASQLYVANIFRGGADRPYTSTESLVSALEWMVANHVPVVNISLAGPPNAILDRLVERTIAKGTMIVAAAGNGGPSAPPAYPAAIRPVVAVTAVDGRMRIYRYANQGRYIMVASNGVDEPAAQAKGGIGRFSGTSFATPHVTAWMARCLQGHDGSTCVSRLRESARDLGQPGFDQVYGFGYVK
jgi:subtilisin family serine protease